MPRTFALLVLIIGSAGYLLLSVTVLHSALSQEEAQAWPGYYAVLFEEHHSVETAERALREAGFAETLSRASATVEFHSFDSIEQLPVSEIPSRFDPIDPRLDPYMQRVSELFRAYVEGDAYEIVYVRSDRAPLTVLPGIARVLGAAGIRAEFPSWHPLSSLSAIIVGALFAAIVVRRSPKRRAVICVGALPWLMTAAVGGLSSLPAVLTLFFTWAYAAEVVVPAYRELLRAKRPQFESAPLLRRALLFAFALTLAIAITQSARGGINVVPAAAAGVVLLFAAAAQEAIRARLQEHRVFTPVSIRRRELFRRRGGQQSTYQAAVPWLLCIVLAAPFAVLILPEEHMPAIPQPQRVGAVDTMTPQSLRDLWSSSRGGEFPTFADWVAHRAYQSSFMYGGEFALPELGSSVSLARFSSRDGTMRQYRETVLEFDEHWFDTVTDVVGESTLAGLLSHGGSPGGVVRERLHRLYWHPLNVVRQISLVVLVFVPVMIGQGILSIAVRRAAIGEFARRRRQAA